MQDTLSRRSILKTLAGTSASCMLPLSAEAMSSTSAERSSSHLFQPATHESSEQQRSRWAKAAQALWRAPHEQPQAPLKLVTPVADTTKYLRWRMEPEAEASKLSQRLLHRGDHFILDFGGHRAGHFAFRLVGEGKSVDSPVRLKLTFGEVPGDVAEPLYPSKGTLSTAWLPEEIITVDFLPQEVKMPRRYAFRYVKVEVMDTSPNFGVRFFDVKAIALSAVTTELPPLPSTAPAWIQQVDTIGAHTLRDCMQTTFEDGPRRDQRLWLGDLRLQARTNYVTYRSYDLVRRCLYLFASLSRNDGMVSACVFEKPTPMGTEPFLNDYSALFISALLELTVASKDLVVARDLYPVARRQMEILLGRFDAEMNYKLPANEYIFIDWNRDLDYSAAWMGVMGYTLEHLVQLAKLTGHQDDAERYAAALRKIRSAAHTRYYDASLGYCTAGKGQPISWATQSWMVLGGCLSREEAQRSMRNVVNNPSTVKPSTPYLYHYVTEAFAACGMDEEALKLIKSYWGSMAAAGADTFWELYNPADSTYSPYGDVHLNSFCHAWSCTPCWFFRDRKLGL